MTRGDRSEPSALRVGCGTWPKAHRTDPDADQGQRDMTIGFQPAADNVLVRPITTNNVGVDSTVDWAEVIAVGPGRRTADGTLVAPDFTPGDQVALRPRSAVHLNIHGEAWAIVSASDVLGIMLQNAEASASKPEDVSSSRAIPEPPAQTSPSFEQSLETDVAPDLLDRESPTAEDLH
jgi:co-chaperonin GroES (HSP10)